MRHIGLIFCLMVIAACTAPLSQKPRTMGGRTGPVMTLPPDVALTPKPVPPRTKISLAALGSYDPMGIIAIFGPPSLDRSEGGTRILQFTSSRCVTDMVFDEGDALIHVESRAKTGPAIAIQPCLDSYDQALVN